MILVLSYNCVCIICINLEKLWFIVSSTSESSLTIRCLKSRIPFYDNFYSLQNRKTPFNFLCFSRDACGIKTQSFVPATDTVDQRPNVSPLVIFAELTSTFFVHVLNWNFFQILLKGGKASERKRELKVWSEKITSHDIILVHHLARCIPVNLLSMVLFIKSSVFPLVPCT